MSHLHIGKNWFLIMLGLTAATTGTASCSALNNQIIQQQLQPSEIAQASALTESITSSFIPLEENNLVQKDVARKLGFKRPPAIKVPALSLSKNAKIASASTFGRGRSSMIRRQREATKIVSPTSSNTSVTRKKVLAENDRIKRTKRIQRQLGQIKQELQLEIPTLGTDAPTNDSKLVLEPPTENVDPLLKVETVSTSTTNNIKTLEVPLTKLENLQPLEQLPLLEKVRPIETVPVPQIGNANVDNPQTVTSSSTSSVELQSAAPISIETPTKELEKVSLMKHAVPDIQLESGRKPAQNVCDDKKVINFDKVKGYKPVHAYKNQRKCYDSESETDKASSCWENSESEYEKHSDSDHEKYSDSESEKHSDCESESQYESFSGSCSGSDSDSGKSYSEEEYSSNSDYHKRRHRNSSCDEQSKWGCSDSEDDKKVCCKKPIDTKCKKIENFNNFKKDFKEEKPCACQTAPKNLKQLKDCSCNDNFGAQKRKTRFDSPDNLFRVNQEKTNRFQNRNGNRHSDFSNDRPTFKKNYDKDCFLESGKKEIKVENFSPLQNKDFDFSNRKPRVGNQLMQKGTKQITASSKKISVPMNKAFKKLTYDLMADTETTNFFDSMMNGVMEGTQEETVKYILAQTDPAVNTAVIEEDKSAVKPSNKPVVQQEETKPKTEKKQQFSRLLRKTEDKAFGVNVSKGLKDRLKYSNRPARLMKKLEEKLNKQQPAELQGTE